MASDTTVDVVQTAITVDIAGAIVGDQSAYVTSFNGRAGAVAPATGDYTAAQITETETAKILTASERALIASALQAESDPVASAALSGHISSHPAPTTRDTRNEAAGTAATAVSVHKTESGAHTLDKITEGASLSENALGTASGETAINHAYNLQFATVTLDGTAVTFVKGTGWPKHGSITAFADAGDGQITVTSAGHGLTAGKTIVIAGTTNYNGTYTVESADTDTFVIMATWVSDDATGTFGERKLAEIRMILNITSTTGITWTIIDGGWMTSDPTLDTGVYEIVLSQKEDGKIYGHYVGVRQ